MKISCEFHDWSVLNNRLDLLYKIKEHYPNFKVSMFTIPFDSRFELDTQKIYRKQALKEIKKNLDWIQIIPHGLTHIDREMENCDYELFKKSVMPSIKEVFDRDELPFEKGFCAPYWLWNEDVVRALDEEGWWGAIDRNQPDMLSTKKFYKYSHSLEEPFWLSTNEIVKLHGHIDGTSANDIERCITNMMKIPVDAEWHFITDFLEERKDEKD